MLQKALTRSLFLGLIAFCCFSFCSCKSLTNGTRKGKQYNGYKVISVNKILNKEQLELLQTLQKNIPDLDFWSDPSLTRKTEIMVPPNELASVEEYLKENDLVYSVSIPDVQNVLERQLVRVRTGRQSVMNWRNYQRLNTIYSWLDSLSFQHPNLVTVSSIGKSYEQRDIKMVKISTGGYRKKPAIYLDAGIHAREWIAPATATYIVNELVKSNLDYEILSDVDWYIVPVVNPDGYEYTHTEDRLWRKSRSQAHAPDCVGVDLNRNFDFHWGEEGVKDDPCANTYPGPSPFSEVEANATAKFLFENRKRLKGYITLHSYSQLILTPYGYTEELADDYEDLKEVGDKAARAIEDVHQTEYTVGPPSHILYKNSGSSRDWAKGVADIKYSYTIELPDKGDNGFLLPPREIIPSAEETWEGIKVIAKQIGRTYLYKK